MRCAITGEWAYSEAESALHDARDEARIFTDEIDAIKRRRYRKRAGGSLLDVTALTKILKDRYGSRMVEQNARQLIMTRERGAYEHRREMIFGKKARSYDALLTWAGHGGVRSWPLYAESPFSRMLKKAQ